MYEIFLLLHILGATVWTGGHIVLSAVVLPGVLRDKSPEQMRRFEGGFEKIGIPALIIQVATGLFLADRMLGETGEWFSFEDPVSRLVSAKLLLLALTAGFAVDARLRLIPRLSQGNLVSLAWHIIPVTIISILLVVAGVSFRTGWFY